MSNGDFISGIAAEEMIQISLNIALRSKIQQHQAYSILAKIGFYEERYGAKPIIIERIVRLSNNGCATDRIFAAIKLVPNPNDIEAVLSISDDAVEISGKILKGEDPKPTQIFKGVRVIDL